MKKRVYALSICGRIVMDMHSLNNEGGEGNQIQTRMVTIVNRSNGQYQVATVNAISGDMFKHIQTEHFYRLAKGQLPLCKGCQTFSANRILDDSDFMGNIRGPYSQVIDNMLHTCSLDDVAGNLIAQGNRSIPRKSVAEFGWVIGLPEITRTESYFHVRYAADLGVEGEVEQPIFHRPASSGIYSIVANFEIARIGFNDITQTYAIDDEQREKRYKTLLKSILYTFIEPNGAMRSTQNPHILGFEGVVTVSTGISPAPLLSPLDNEYENELMRVIKALNEVNGNKDGNGNDVVTAYKFENLGSFAEKIKMLIDETEPFKMEYGE